MYARIQRFRTAHERKHLLLVQQRLAARYRQMAEARARRGGLLQFSCDVPAMRRKVLVIVLIRIGAEIAASRAAQIDEERSGALARATDQARR